MIIVNNEYSFSRLSSFDENCKYEWYKTYIEGDRGENNCFAEYGTIFHELIESVIKEEIFIFEAEEKFKQRFNNMEYPFPDKFKDSYYNRGIKFFKNFVGFDGFKPLESEEESKFQIGGYWFKGFPDLVAKKKDKLYVIDYKTSRIYIKEQLPKKLRQLYFYSIPVKKKYGRYPDFLRFEFVRVDDFIEVPFRIKKLEETKKWALDVIRRIKREDKWEPNTKNEFYCNMLCSHRKECEFRKTKNDITII